MLYAKWKESLFKP